MLIKILLVDDVDMFIEVQKSYLQASAVTIFTANSGQDAFRICQIEHPDIVFMDAAMPEVSGADCCRAIKDIPSLQDIKVVLIADKNRPGELEQCQAHGVNCNSLLLRPLERNSFMDTLRNLLPAVERSNARIKCHIKVDVIDSFGAPLSGMVHDLSQKGIYLTIEHVLERRCDLHFTFTLPDTENTVFSAIGKVVWENTKVRQENPDQKGYGIEFTSVPEEAHAKLAMFINDNT